MTFLNPIYLIALASAAIPILLHLLNLRKARIVEFSTLAFLKELQRSKIRKLKIRQWLLLVLRTLIIIFVVLAFTRPAMRSSLGFLPGTSAKSSVVLVIDDSFSMLAEDENGQLLKQAGEKALAILDIMSPGDEVALIRSSEAAETEREFTAALGTLRDEIGEMQPAFTSTPASEMLLAAQLLLEQSNNFNKEIYFISDDQRAAFVSEAEKTTIPEFDEAVKLFHLKLGNRRPENTAVIDVTVENSIFERGKPVDLTATILNDAGSSISGAIASVYLQGERIVQKAVDIESGSSKQVQFSITPQEGGFQRGFIEMEDDDLPEDNRRYFSFHIPENIRVLLGPAEGKDAEILRLALEPVREESGTSFRIDPVSRNTLISSNLAKYDVVVLLGAEFASNAFLKRFADYIRKGGNAFLLPDANGNTDTFTQQLLPLLEIPSARGTNGSLSKTDSWTTFGKVDFDHPLFQGVFRIDDPDKMPEIESPRLYYSLRLRGNETVHPVVTSTSGDAVLLDHRLEKGRVLVLAMSTDLRWSDFPVKGIFLPLVNRSMYYLAVQDERTRQHLAGRPFEMIVPAVSTASSCELISPEGGSSRVVPKSMPSGLHFTLAGMDVPGVYELRTGTKILQTVAVNTDPDESRMERIPENEVEELFGKMGLKTVNFLDRGENVRQAVTESRFGVELWKYMIILALLCALTEMLIAREAKHAAPEMQKI